MKQSIRELLEPLRDLLEKFDYRSDEDLVEELVVRHRSESEQLKRMRSALKNAVHVLDKGLRMRIDERWPILRSAVDSAIADGRAALQSMSPSEAQDELKRQQDSARPRPATVGEQLEGDGDQCEIEICMGACLIMRHRDEPSRVVVETTDNGEYLLSLPSILSVTEIEDIARLILNTRNTFFDRGTQHGKAERDREIQSVMGTIMAPITNAIAPGRDQA